MKSYIYLRVSTEIQNEKKTWKTQLSELKKYAVSQRIFIFNVYLDIGSGKDLKRKEFHKILSVLEKGDQILVYDQDRLSRDTIETLTLIQFFKDQDIKIFTPNGPLVFDTPEQEFVITILAATKKLERQQINKRIKSGITRFKDENGRWGRKKSMEGNTEKLFNKYYFEKNIKNKSSLAKLLGISRTTLYRYMKEKQLLEQKS